MRPWTRIECARLTEEARSNFGRSDSIYDDQAAPLYTRLSEEFSFEIHVLAGASNRRVEETQAYLRATEITGPPLRDSFHFGQTIYNDFGRPYGQGFNASAGTQVQAMFGPVSVSVRGEFQSSRALFSYGPNALAAIASADALPVMTMPNIGAYQRFRPLEATVSLKLAGWQATFGEQPQWWGVSRSTSLLLSNNAEAPVLLLIKRDKPIQLPGFLAYLGQFRDTFFVGELRGQHFVRGPIPTLALEGSQTKTLNPQPFIWGDQLNLKVSPNLEIGFEIVAVWAGYGRPATIGTFLHTFSNLGNNQAVDPGKRYGGFHFAYALPGVRTVSLYTDTVSNDEPTPLVYPKESAISSGLDFATLPRLKNVELRVEGLYTNIPHYADGIGAVYFNEHYADGYRNAGQLMGSWVGRAGIGYDAKATYWFSHDRHIDLGLRRQTNDQHFIGGGGLTDVSSHIFWPLRNGWEAEGNLTAERWRFPVLPDSAQHPFVATFGLTYSPHISLSTHHY